MCHRIKICSWDYTSWFQICFNKWRILYLYFFRKGSVDFPSVAKATFALNISVNIDSMQRINERCFHYRSGRVKVCLFCRETCFLIYLYEFGICECNVTRGQCRVTSYDLNRTCRLKQPCVNKSSKCYSVWLQEVTCLLLLNSCWSNAIYICTEIIICQWHI